MITVCIASFGSDRWRDLAWSRAYPSASGQATEVVVCHDPHGTIASTRNQAAQEAEGDWLIFLDADDELAPGYIKAMEHALVTHNYAKALYLPKTSFARGATKRRPHFLPDCSLRDGNPMIIGTMVSREMFLDVGGFTEGVELFEDWMLFAQLWRGGAPVIRVADAIYVAHMERHSRNRSVRGPGRVYWHQWIGHAVFPERYLPTLPEEDALRKLFNRGRPTNELRFNHE